LTGSVFLLLNNPAGDFSTCVTRRLGAEIVGAAVDDHRAADDLFHPETVGLDRQIGTPAP